MKLENMNLNNFRQFYGDQKIKFSRDSNKNVTVINGVNGAGKTSLLIALTWCLYGKYDENFGELINKRAIRETPVGFDIESAVQVMFMHRGEKYTARRVITAEKETDKKYSRKTESTFTLAKICSDGRFEKIPNSTGFIEFVLPSSVSQYFFFDGEKIDEFTKTGHEDEVEDAVRKVLKIEVLERSRDHLNVVAKQYQKELKMKAAGELHDLISRKTNFTEKLDIKKKEMQNLNDERSAVRRQEAEIIEKLSNLEHSRELSEKRKQINVKVETLIDEKNGLWLNIRDLCGKCFVLYATPKLEKALELLDKQRERGEMPPGIREQFVKDLIEREICICTRPVKEGSDEYIALTKLLGKTVSSELENAIIQTAGDIRALNASSRDIIEQMNRLMKRKVEIENTVEILAQELDEISRNLTEIDLEDIGVLENKRAEWRENIGLLTGKIESAQSNISLLDKDIGNIQVEIDKAHLKEKSARRLQRQLSLAYKASEAIEKMCDTFASDMRKQIQQELLGIFHSLIWKNTQFQNVGLTDDYQLEVFDRWGYPARRELSAGERQVLSLSFITGMANVTGEEAPLVIDTPFGRLSKIHRANITKHIPAITKQLILFVTDEELTGEARTNLEPRIGLEYELVFDQDTGSTTIKQISL